MGWRFRTVVAVSGCVLMISGAMAGAQYPGKVKKSGKPDPILRSVAVLEWVGEAGKPSASRLVPVSVYDGQQLNDGTIYLTQPAPLALSGGVEYELQAGGKPFGLFDVFGAGELGGAWRGYGVWKPLSAKEAAAAEGAFNTSSLAAPVKVEDDEHPVLKRKHPKGSDGDDSDKKADSETEDASAKTAPTASGASDADPDRPTLKRKSAGDSDSGSARASSPAPAADSDPDRPTIRRTRKSVSDAAMAETSTVEPDPDRPRLKHGRPDDLGPPEPPKLEGLPPTMQQAVAVSDTRFKPEHPWHYTWADPADELKMKAALEGMARTALGLDAPTVKPVRKTVAGKRVAKAATPPPVAELAEENFKVFELTFGSSATMVLTAATPKPELVGVPDNAVADDGPPAIRRGKPVAKAAKPDAPTVIAPAAKRAPQKFVTLIAQPDLYGGVIVLLKSTTDSAHLDVTPRMRLVDAVDAEGDNRGELLFEMRGDGQRQFALYRVMRGSAEQLFATVGIP